LGPRLLDRFPEDLPTDDALSGPRAYVSAHRRFPRRSGRRHRCLAQLLRGGLHGRLRVGWRIRFHGWKGPRSGKRGLQEGNVALELLVPVPWARVIAQALPDKGFAMLKAHAKKIMLRRRTEGAKGGSRDLMYFLLNEDGQGTHAPFDDDTLEYEAVLAMVAGSDTTSTAMANSVFYLMENPKYYARLRAELDEAAEKSEITSVEDHLDVHVLATLPFLNAVMQAFTHLLPDLY
jgi:hypothetical protein